MTNRSGEDRRVSTHPAQQFQEVPPIPERLGPCRFGRLGFWITVQCPSEFDPLLLKAGAVWDPGDRRWLLRLHRVGPILRALRRHTDPLFRRAGIVLDAAT